MVGDGVRFAVALEVKTIFLSLENDVIGAEGTLDLLAVLRIMAK